MPLKDEGSIFGRKGAPSCSPGIGTMAAASPGAAFLSARNDAVANVAIIATGFVTAYTLSAWPDLIVGLAIAAINADAAREVWEAARQEDLAAKA